MNRPTKPGRYLILGCGHTGTTLISGILHINGYGSFKVSRLFENIELNRLNERILSPIEVPDAETIEFISRVERRTRGRWCLKDPRLSETISTFYRFVPDPKRLIFNFRSPGAAVKSLIRDREIYERHLTPEAMRESAEEEWLRRNRAVLEFLDTENQSPYLMVDYDDLVDRELDEILCRFVGRPLDMTFIDPTRRHSSPMLVGRELLDLYDDLKRRCAANHESVMGETAHVAVPRHRRRTLMTRFHLTTNRVTNGLRWRLSRLNARFEGIRIDRLS